MLHRSRVIAYTCTTKIGKFKYSVLSSSKYITLYTFHNEVEIELYKHRIIENIKKSYNECKNLRNWEVVIVICKDWVKKRKSEMEDIYRRTS